MKLKYYLRGLGIGIIVTALLMGYSDKNRAAQAATTQETVQEENSGLLAERNGSENGQTVQSVEEETQTVTESTAEALSIEETQTQTEPETEAETTTTTETVSTIEETETETVTETETGTQTEAQTVTETSAEAAVSEESAQSTQTRSTSTGSMVEITISRGDDSGTVSRKLHNAGLVESATEYDAYLMQHGYDKKIRVGTVDIPADATWQEIAEYISGKR